VARVAEESEPMIDTVAFYDLPGWTFVPFKLPDGQWRVDGVHTDERFVSRAGSDLELLLIECADHARKLR